MAVTQLSSGRWRVKTYDPSTKKLKHVGNYESRAEAEAVDNGLRSNPNAVKELLSKNAGYVYFIHDATSDAVKIGWAKDPFARLRDLQIGNPNNLTLAFCFATERNTERILHKRFRNQHIRGEWFDESVLIGYAMGTYTYLKDVA